MDHRTDLYALGCVAYEMLCGQTPFGVRPFHQLISAHLTETPEPITTRRAQVPAALASLVMQCLETDQEARPKDARTVVQALEQADLRSGERTASMTAPSSVRRASTLVFGGALLAVVAFFGLRALAPDQGPKR